LRDSDVFVLFVGPVLGKTQRREMYLATQLSDERKVGDQVMHRIVVKLGDAPLPSGVGLEAEGLFRISVPGKDRKDAIDCARQIVTRLLGEDKWFDDDGLPRGYPFSHERKIIEAYQRGLSPEEVEQGCPEMWPDLHPDPADQDNPITEEEIETYRHEGAAISVDPRTGRRFLAVGGEETEGRSEKQRFTFPEAGPREKLRFPVGDHLTVGILVSGGIVPGINAVIDGIVSRHTLYEARLGGYEVFIWGYPEGFKGLLSEGVFRRRLYEGEVERESGHAGSLLATSRTDQLLDPDPLVRSANINRVIDRLHQHGVEILYVIGGDGSMRAAHAIAEMAERRAGHGGRSVSVVGIPKTTDNDILWVWQSFGFLSAVEKAREAVLSLHTEVRSNPRLCIIQLFGSDSGFVVSHAAWGSGACDAALIPEVDFSMKGLSAHITKALLRRYKPNEGESPYGLIVMAETAIPTDARDYVEDTDYVRLTPDEKTAVLGFLRERRVHGQTPDELRTGGLKIVSRVLQRDIHRMAPGGDAYWRSFRVFTNEPRHLLRSVPPSLSDVSFAERLGTLAVDSAMAGYKDFMVSQWLTEFVLVPLRLVVLGRKRLPSDGILWKSVLASTGQPANM
jgi:6-phosphofructokinase 1